MKKDAVISEIEKVRSLNNKNWMDLVRLAFKTAPKEAKAIFKRINECDTEISSLLKKVCK